MHCYAVMDIFLRAMHISIGDHSFATYILVIQILACILSSGRESFALTQQLEGKENSPID